MYPGNFDVYYERGYTKYRALKYEEAIRDFDIIINVNSKHYNAYYYRGCSKKYLKNYDEAINDLNKAIEYDPNNPNYYSEKASCYDSLNKYRESIENYDKAIELNDNDWFLYILRAKDKFLLSKETNSENKTNDKKSFFNKIISKIALSKNYTDLEKSALNDLEKSYKLALEDEFYLMVFKDIIKDEFSNIDLAAEFCKDKNITL
nr:tetratricopeptide repeat protein [uncultured Brachyspira sp.]